jgi:GT2 family glycosyltransferase
VSERDYPLISMPEIDLVVICYNSHTETEAFFESLVHVDVVYRLICVVNPGPEHERMLQIVADGVEAAKQGNCLEAQVIVMEDNVGYARAVNRGVSQGNAKYIGILNNDLLFRPNMVARLVEYFENPNWSKVAIIGPKQVDSNGKLTHGGIVPMGNGWDRHRFWMEPDVGQANDTFDAPMVSGSALFTRRDVWTRMANCQQYTAAAPQAEGAFLPTPHFFEETYYCYHVRLHGYYCRYVGDLEMVHEWHRSSPPGSKDMEKPRLMFMQALAIHGFKIGDKI